MEVTVIDFNYYGQDCAGELSYCGPDLTGQSVRVRVVTTTSRPVEPFGDVRAEKVRADHLALGAADVSVEWR